ncbi:hypothetical protein [Bacillus altitudinis]|uniref:hypothetical protein n=1 Tax=Bacillus altitudinis TaxID=293387 RepID=UPI0022826145|nr:hypothetical protein [Bacillus altitudinis]MCY7581525.1 hypothetical protein [Bacillus altitudinis]MCY7594367.1 hypothetical protein [Bacillus altitudinis]GLF91628.1 hypothetical protein Saga11_28870 [Bacillus safensis]
MVIKNPQIPKDNIDKKNLELQTNLDLSQEIIDGINELKEMFPEYLPMVSYLTISYVIRIIVRSAMIKKNGELKPDSKER